MYLKVNYISQSDFANTMSLDVQMEIPWDEAAEVKQQELRRAIDELDRKFARKLMIDEQVPAVDVERKKLMRFLFVAVQSRDPQLVRELLKQKPQLNNEEGGRMLWLVAQDGNTDIASMLVRAGADVNWENPFEPTERGLLHFLIESDSPKKHQLALLMMQHGADVNIEDLNCDTPLDYAIKKDEPVELVKELIARGAIVDEIIISETAKHPKAVKLVPMLINGYFHEANTVNEKISITISYLCSVDIDESRIVPLVKALIDLMIPRDEVVLMAAVLYGRIEILTLLLDHGLGANLLSSLLHLATCCDQSTVAQLLIKRGANINYRIQCDDFGHKNQYPIHTACENKSLSNVKLLLRLGVDVNITDSLGNTPFSLIGDLNLNNINREMIKHFAILISKGMKVNDKDLALIRSRADLSTFFEKCLSELQYMKQSKIFNHISVHTMLIQDVKRLSWLTRNCKLVENYNRTKSKALFPLYHSEIEWKFRNSEKRKKLLISQDEAACEVLNDILPNLVVAKIIFYLYIDNVNAFESSVNI